ncbi:MAG: alpha/beta hydrolase [Cyanobacteria bacterium P01_B01_bin.77]
MSDSIQHIGTNGINIAARVQGSGPLVILVHGFPELWYSWRHQIEPIANAGFKVVAIDVRGYGNSDKPHTIDAYDMVELTTDIVGLIDAFGAEKAILIGHDWGAPICWNTAALYPQRVAAVIGLSVPYFQRAEVSTLELYKQVYAGKFFYQLYFLKEGVAEAELEADIRRTLRMMYYSASGEGIAEASQATAQKGAEANFLDGLIDPAPFPGWLSEKDFDYYTQAFSKSGFRGPLNRYRAQQRDWEILPQLSELTIEPPSYFIAGSLDLVRYLMPGMDLYKDPGASCTDFRGKVIIEGKGHWIQQEAPEQVNKVLLNFLSSIA